MIRNFIFSVIGVSVFLGCVGTTYNFKIRFNDIDWLRKNDPVFFDKTSIGVVTDVEYTDKGNYLVSVALENEFVEGLKDLSESEQIKQIERQLDKILAEIKNLSTETKYKLETEILPRIKEQIEELKRRLERIGKEEKLEYVEQKIEKISAKL